MIASIAIPVFHASYDFEFIKGSIVQFYLLLCLVFIIPVLIENYETMAFDYISLVIVYAFFIQGLIQIAGFLYSPLGDFLVSIKPEELADRFDDDNEFRGYSLTGSPFFELPAGLGVAFILYFKLQFSKNKHLVSGIKNYIIFFVLFIGAMFAGRTAYTGLLLGLLMSIYIAKAPVQKIFSFAKSIAVLVLIAMLVLSQLRGKQRDRVVNEIFPFAFEFYYNYIEKGKFSTSSTDMLSYMYDLPSTDIAILFGEGYYIDSNGRYYGGSDAGYIRHIYFGGILIVVLLLIYQLFFFYKPIKLAYLENSKADLLLFFTLFTHILIDNVKGEVIGRMNIMQILMMAVGIAYIIQYENKITDRANENSLLNTGDV
jgi:hypothetical protein